MNYLLAIELLRAPTIGYESDWLSILNRSSLEY
jgi:hypothetical protein